MTLHGSLSRIIERRRTRRNVLSSGRRLDGRALPYTEGQAVVDRGAIGPAVVPAPAAAASDA
jgi:hypothetical protein